MESDYSTQLLLKSQMKAIERGKAGGKTSKTFAHEILFFEEIGSNEGSTWHFKLKNQSCWSAIYYFADLFERKGS